MQCFLNAVIGAELIDFKMIIVNLVGGLIAVQLGAYRLHLLAQIILTLIFVYCRLRFLIDSAVYLPYFALFVKHFNKYLGALYRVGLLKHILSVIIRSRNV